MRWYEKIISAHTAVTSAVSHVERMKSDRYFVWTEDGTNDLVTGGGHTEKAVTGSTSLFTKEEFDEWADRLGEEFDNAGIAWERNYFDFEEDTGFFHVGWDWTVTDDGASND